MKITLNIDDGHAPVFIQLLAELIAKASPVEAPADPAPGHPELPLEDEGDLRWCLAGELDNPTTVADPLRVAMNDPVEDTRPAIVPVPGRAYRTREGNVMVAIKVVQPHSRVLTHVRGDSNLPFYYEINGLPCGGCGPEWDLVEELPF
jgi:hypothetical protein